jgi:hypothetical protein
MLLSHFLCFLFGHLPVFIAHASVCVQKLQAPDVILTFMYRCCFQSTIVEGRLFSALQVLVICGFIFQTNLWLSIV